MVKVIKKQSEALTLHTQCKAVLYYLRPCRQIYLFVREYLARILHSDETTGNLVRGLIDVTLLNYVSYILCCLRLYDFPIKFVTVDAVDHFSCRIL